MPAVDGPSLRALLAIAVLGATCVPSPAGAQASAPLELSWDVPASCPGERHVIARVQELAGSAPPPEQTLRAAGTITRSESGKLRLELVVRSGELTGIRRIEGTSCDDLAGAAAVALALLLRSPALITEEAGRRDGGPEAPAGGGAAGGESSASSRPPNAPPLPGPQEPPPPGESRNRETGRPRRWSVLLQAPIVVLGIGPLPGPGAGLGVAGGLSIARWRLLLEGTAWLPQRMTSAEEPGIAADLMLLSGGVRGCWALAEGAFEVAPCVTLGAEHLRARGSGDRIMARSAAAVWLATGAGVQGQWRIGPRFALVGGIFGRIETSQPRIDIDGVGSLGQTAPMSVRIVLGGQWIL